MTDSQVLVLLSLRPVGRMLRVRSLLISGDPDSSMTEAEGSAPGGQGAARRAASFWVCLCQGQAKGWGQRLGSKVWSSVGSAPPF